MAEPVELAGGYEAAYDASFLVAYQAAFRVVASRSEAEDIAQEAMVRAYLRWNQIEGYAQPWVVRVATNLALDATRRRQRTMRFPARPSDGAPATDERLDLARAIARLPKRQREAVALRSIADLSEEDTARAMGCSAGTVKQHASRGLAALRASGQLAVEYS